mgnify:CR=1 FL=1
MTHGRNLGTLANAPPASVCYYASLLTDGTVLAQGVSTNQLVPADARCKRKLRQRHLGDDGQQRPRAAVLRLGDPARRPASSSGGGEYDAGAMVWLLNAEMYDPAANTWTTLPVPAGWVRIGDAPGCVLPDGRFFLGQVATRNTAIYDPATNTWAAAANKINSVGEESWSLLPDGTIHAVDCSNPPNAEKYIIASNQWVAAGATPQVLVDSISEIGASALLPDGRVFVIGATGFTALYTPPPIANQVGTWAQGPTIPQVNPDQRSARSTRRRWCCRTATSCSAPGRSRHRRRSRRRPSSSSTTRRPTPSTPCRPRRPRRTCRTGAGC